MMVDIELWRKIQLLRQYRDVLLHSCVHLPSDSLVPQGVRGFNAGCLSGRNKRGYHRGAEQQRQNQEIRADIGS